jgi:murein L,D-transpeptidase YcbB/YkuD
VFQELEMIPASFFRHLLLSISILPVVLPGVLTASDSLTVSAPVPSQSVTARPAPVAAVSVPASNPLLRVTAESIRDQGPLTVDGVPLESGQALANFYAARGYRLAWQDSAQVEALLQAVEAAQVAGFQPADYHVATLRRLSKPGHLDGLASAERLAADLQLSDALLRYTYHIRFGRVDPAAVNRFWNHRKGVPVETLIRSMEQVVSAADMRSSLADLAEKPFFFADLERALQNFGSSRPAAALPQIPQGKKLVPGRRDPRVVLLRERLRALGDESLVPDDPEFFDPALSEAVMRFQKRSGLNADGVAGSSTITALNQPFDEKKADQIRINLERMRWFYDALPADYVLVDVAGFMAHVVRDGRIDWSTRVVVGTPKDQTPSFRDEMEHVVFNPTWTVPPSIQKKMRGVSSRFKVVDRRTGRAVSGANVSDPRRYSIVQGPGPSNALGRVKFIFPNDHAVYLHDTQSKGLFSQNVRAYSHGCVRVQDPLKLAEVILGEANWNRRQIDRVISTNKTRYVILDERLPVLLYYLTAYADENGRVGFRSDIYGRDAALRQAFKGPASPLRIAFPKPRPLVEPAAPQTQPVAGRTAATPGPAPTGPGA